MGGAELAVLVLVLLGDPIMHERLIKVIGGFLFTSELEKKLWLFLFCNDISSSFGKMQGIFLFVRINFDQQKFLYDKNLL